MSERSPLKLVVVKPDAVETRFFRSSDRQFGEHVRGAYRGAYFTAGAGASQVAMRDRCFGVDTTNIPVGFQPWYDKYEWDYVVMYDTDMVFDPWMIDRMIKADVDIIGAAAVKEDFSSLAGGIQEPIEGPEGYIDCPICKSTGKVGKKVCLQCNGEKKIRMDRIRPLQPKDIEGKDRIKALYCGFGLMVIKRDVFRKIPYPWFNHIDVQGQSGVARNAGVDISFCMRAHQHGIDIWIDCVVSSLIGHEKHRVLRLEDMLWHRLKSMADKDKIHKYLEEIIDRVEKEKA